MPGHFNHPNNVIMPSHMLSQYTNIFSMCRLLCFYSFTHMYSPHQLSDSHFRVLPKPDSLNNLQISVPGYYLYSLAWFEFSRTSAVLSRREISKVFSFVSASPLTVFTKSAWPEIAKVHLHSHREQSFFQFFKPNFIKSDKPWYHRLISLYQCISQILPWYN